jgi:hypothetical protein
MQPPNKKYEMLRGSGGGSGGGINQNPLLQAPSIPAPSSPDQTKNNSSST